MCWFCDGYSGSGSSLHAAVQSEAVKLSFHNATLKEITTAFTEQTGVGFSYEKSLGDRVIPNVNVNVNVSTVEEMLSAVFGETDIAYKIRGKVVALTLRPTPEVHAASSASNVGSVSGRVTDESNQPLIGVSVVVKGTTVGTTTDVVGRFTIHVPHNGTLQLSYLGFHAEEVNVGTRTEINVAMRENRQVLDEVVVIGYGTLKKCNLVGAVDQVDSKVIGDRYNGNLARSLQGEVPGLNISFTDSKPSRSASFNVRGSSSIGAGGSTLVLIDGVEGSLNTINPQRC